jgi:hypothetical protein
MTYRREDRQLRILQCVLLIDETASTEIRAGVRALKETSVYR